MKKCPFCAEEIQDAAIKCKHCGSMLTEAIPVQVLVPPPHAALDEDIKRLLGAGKKIGAIELARERKTLGLAAAKAYVEAVEKGADPEQAVASAPKNANAAGGCLVVILILGVLVYFLPSLIVDFASGGKTTYSPSTGITTTSPSAPAPAAALSAQTAPVQNTAAAEAAREVVDNFVKNGFIKRMEVNTGKFYVDGELWAVFELDEKKNIVKFISAYRDAEHDLPQVTLYESRSGKELASYGAFSGVTIR